MDRILLTRIGKKSAAVALLLAAASAFIDVKRLPVSIIVGCALGFANITGLAWGVRGLRGAAATTGKMVFFSQFRLLIIFTLLALLLYLRLVGIAGVLVGFTVVFAITLIEGYRFSKRPPGEDG